MKLLVIVDMQKDFTYGCLGTEEAKAVIGKIAEYTRNFAGDIVFTRDTHDSGYLDTQEGKKLPVEHCIKGTEGWEIVPELKDAEQNAKAIFDKQTFGSLELAQYIANAGNKYDEVQFCGVCTGICVISNALLVKAHMPEMPLAVLKDLCACVTPESHQTALDAMATCQIEIQ